MVPVVVVQSFSRSNRMSHVNGRVYGNLEELEVRARKLSRKPSVFYFFSLNRGVTSVHVSGQVLTVNRHRSVNAARDGVKVSCCLCACVFVCVCVCARVRVRSCVRACVCV